MTKFIMFFWVTLFCCSITSQLLAGVGNAEGLQEIIQKAQNGDAGAQLSLGKMYHSGEGVTRHLKNATKWYRKAAEQGNVQAQTILGEMYLDGFEVKADIKKATKWITRASKQGDAEAKTLLLKLNKKKKFQAKLSFDSAIFYFKRGDFNKAHKLMTEAIQIFPEYEEAKEQLVLIKNKKNETATSPAKSIQQSAPVIIIGVERERKRQEKARRKAARKAADKKRRAEEAQISAKRADIYSKCRRTFQSTCERDCSANKYQYNRSCYQACISTHCR